MMATVNQAYDLLSGFQIQYNPDERNVVVHAMLVEMLRVYLVTNNRWIVYQPSHTTPTTKFQYKYPPYMCLIYLHHDFNDRSAEMVSVDISQTFEETIRHVSFSTFAIMVFTCIKRRQPLRYNMITSHWESIMKYVKDKLNHKQQWLLRGVCPQSVCHKPRYTGHPW